MQKKHIQSTFRGEILPESRKDYYNLEVEFRDFDKFEGRCLASGVEIHLSADKECYLLGSIGARVYIKGNLQDNSYLYVRGNFYSFRNLSFTAGKGSLLFMLGSVYSLTNVKLENAVIIGNVACRERLYLKNCVVTGTLNCQGSINANNCIFLGPQIANTYQIENSISLFPVIKTETLSGDFHFLDENVRNVISQEVIEGFYTGLLRTITFLKNPYRNVIHLLEEIVEKEGIIDRNQAEELRKAFSFGSQVLHV